MKELYQEIVTQFEDDKNKEKFRKKGINPIKHINLYFGQEFEEDAEVYLKPALFVKWEIDHNLKTPLATITFKIVYDSLRDTSSNNNKTLKKALNFFDLVEQTTEIIEEIETKKTGKLNLNSEGFNLEPSALDHHTLVYTCTYSNNKSKYIEGSFEKTINKPNLKDRLL